MKLITCFNCGCQQPPESFYADKSRPNGRAAICKECRAAETAKAPTHDMTQAEVAAALGMSRQMAAKIERDALAKARNWLVAAGFGAGFEGLGMGVELLSLSAAAHQLGGISERTVRRLIESGDIQAVKIRGCAPRVLPESIHAYIERLAGQAHNPGSAGQASHNTEQQQCQSAARQAKAGTRMEFTKGRIALTGGQPGRSPADERLAVLLGLR